MISNGISAQRLNFIVFIVVSLDNPKNTGHLEWNALGDFSEFKTNGDRKEAL